MSIRGAELSRRGFVKAAGAAAAVMGLPRWVGAGDATTTPTGVSRHRILTCNILLDLPEQKGTPFDWAGGRRDVCVGLMRSKGPDIVCMQEVGAVQYGDLVKGMPEYASFGHEDPYVDTRPKRFQAIKNVIFYRAERYEVVGGGTYWLSLTPNVAGSRLEGEGLPRHVSWVRLRERGTGKQFRVLDTHWGLKKPTRMAEGPMIVEEARPYAEAFPQVLCGDLNSDSGSEEHKVLHEAGWVDSYAVVHPATTSAPTTEPAPHHRIDYIYYHGPVRPIAAEVFRSADAKRPASDHPFVLADLEI